MRGVYRVHTQIWIALHALQILVVARALLSNGQATCPLQHPTHYHYTRVAFSLYYHYSHSGCVVSASSSAMATLTKWDIGQQHQQRTPK